MTEEDFSASLLIRVLLEVYVHLVTEIDVSPTFPQSCYSKHRCREVVCLCSLPITDKALDLECTGTSHAKVLKGNNICNLFAAILSTLMTKRAFVLQNYFDVADGR